MTTTPYRGYGLIGFGPNGWMSEDLATFNLNLGKIDGDVHALFAALSGKRDADASIGMDKVTGLNDALTGKAAAGHSHQLADLSDVDAAQAGEGYLLARQAGAWVPVSVNAVFGQFSVNINSVDGLADALDAKASSDHNHDSSYYTKSQGDARYLVSSAFTFAGLSGKGAGVDNYSTNGNFISGRGSGGVAMTINDGYGNANLTFNHYQGVPEQNGNAMRIVGNTDSTTGASLQFQLKSGVTGGQADNLTTTLQLTETTASFLGNTMWHSGNHGPGSGLNADLLDSKHASEFVTKDSNYKESGLLNLPDNSITSWAHGKGVVPTIFGAFCVCTVANNGYAVGDRVALGQLAYNRHLTIAASESQIITNHKENALQLLQKDSVATFYPSATQWKVQMWGVWL